MTDMSDLTQTLQHSHPDLQEANLTLEGLWTTIGTMEARIAALHQRITELEGSVKVSHSNSLNLRLSKRASGYLQLFLNRVFGEHAANLLSRFIQDSLSLVAMTSITIVVISFLKFLFNVGGDEIIYLRFLILYGHEGVVTLGVLSRTEKVL
jgi:hypothetical protein